MSLLSNYYLFKKQHNLTIRQLKNRYYLFLNLSLKLKFALTNKRFHLNTSCISQKLFNKLTISLHSLYKSPKL